MRFEFIGRPDDADGNVLVREYSGRMPWKMGIFSTTGVGFDTKLDREMMIAFSQSFVVKDDQLRELVAAVKDGKRRLKVTIEAIDP